MALSIKRNEDYAESNVTIVGLTRMYGRPQFILVDSDEGENPGLKFPGLRFRAPKSSSKTLEDTAVERFEEQTGLTMSKSLGLRTIIPTRSRHGDRWIFRNVFVVVVEDPTIRENDGRQVYVADPGQGFLDGESVSRLGDSRTTAPLNWVVNDNKIVSNVATDVLYHFDWENLSTDYYKRIPCFGVDPQTDSPSNELGCGLAVSSMVLLYQASPNDRKPSIITLQRKGDDQPGYAGGKIETLTSHESRNIDPISCCAREGAEEFGFEVQPRSLIGVATTPLHYPRGKEGSYYNSIVTYSFVAVPTNVEEVKYALDHPREKLEGKMERYCVESWGEHQNRAMRGELRMPDMIPVAKEFYRCPPGDRVNLGHLISSGST